MKKINFILSLFVIAGVCLIASCAKDGETGPKGDKGDTGETGATGAQGPGANTQGFIVNSWGSVPDILTITAADGLNIGSNDVVLSYFKTGSQWALFPYQSFIGGGVFIDYRPYFGTDYFRLNVIQSDGNSINSSDLLSTPRELKIVVIPARLVNPNVNVNDYDEVKAAYNLKD